MRLLRNFYIFIVVFSLLIILGQLESTNIDKAVIGISIILTFTGFAGIYYTNQLNK